MRMSAIITNANINLNPIGMLEVGCFARGEESSSPEPSQSLLSWVVDLAKSWKCSDRSVALPESSYTVELRPNRGSSAGTNSKNFEKNELTVVILQYSYLYSGTTPFSPQADGTKRFGAYAPALRFVYNFPAAAHLTHNAQTYVLVSRRLMVHSDKSLYISQVYTLTAHALQGITKDGMTDVSRSETRMPYPSSFRGNGIVVVD
ncbi:hypothetical protein OF83DRAFT_532717 [Amylostereum chailletii]|nr:hypothetical protein OF83DRAFT_532717 [Amylostereum chailletii]